MQELEKKTAYKVKSNASDQSAQNEANVSVKSFPAVPIQQKTNGEKLQGEKEQHSMPNEESFLFASPSTLPPEDSKSSGEKPAQGKFKSVTQLKKSYSAPIFQFRLNNLIQLQNNEIEPTLNSTENSNGLPAKVQAQMENALGADFSDVNIHTNSQSASDVGALAYTQGNDVHFATGQYDPHSSSGQELIGHELAHVVQQRAGRVQPTTQAKGFPVNDDIGLEAEADEMGRKAVQLKTNTSATIQRNIFGDEQNQIETKTGFTVNNPTFDENTMRQELPNTKIAGADDPHLASAMLTLYQNPDGQELQNALNTIAKIRNLDPTTVTEQYQRAMAIRDAGRQHANPGGKSNDSNDPSPDLNLKQHPDFTGSLSQLRFGSALGDVFGIDPVFGALISPTGGLVGPGNNSVSGPADNGVVLHGTVHDAAGYLLNAHGVGPGYNYLKRSWELDTTNPLAGQVSGVSYWGDGVIGGIGSLGSLGGSVIGGLASDAWNGAKGIASDVWGGVTGAASDVWNGAKGIASDVWGGVSGAARDVSRGLGKAASDIWGGLTGAASDVWSGAKGIASDVWGGVSGAARDVSRGIGSAASDVWSGARGIASDVWGGLSGAASDVSRGIGNAASDVWGGVTGAAGDMLNRTRGIGSGLVDILRDSGIGQPLTSPRLGGILGGLGSGLGGILKDSGIGQPITSLGLGGMLGGLGNGLGGILKDSGIGQPLTAPGLGGILGGLGSGLGGILKDSGIGQPLTSPGIGEILRGLGSGFGGILKDSGIGQPLTPQGLGGLGGRLGGIIKNITTEAINTPMGQDGIGSKPDGMGYSTPWGYAGVDNKNNGLSAGFGLGRVAIPGFTRNIVSGDANIGGYADPDGGTRYGIGASGGVVKDSYDFIALINSLFPGTVDPHYIANLDLGAATASADASINPNSGFSLGAGASIAEAALTLGTTGTGDNDKTGRFGLSEGVGAAIRAHWGDKDKDGLREYGFGFDFGPVSADIKTEDPLRDIGIGLIPGIGAFSNLLPGGNLTEGLANQFGLTSRNASLSDTWDLISGGAKNAYNGVKGLASDAIGGVKSGASNAWKGAKGLASDAWGGLKSEASNAWSGAKDTASDFWDATKHGASNAWSGAKSGASNAWSDAKGLASDAWSGANSGVSNAYNGAKGLASDTWSGVKSTASSAWEGLKDLF